MKQRVLGLMAFLVVGCGPKAEPVAPVESSAPPASTPSAAPAPAEEPPPSAPEPASPVTPVATPTAPSIREVCLAMCEKVKAKCPKSAFESCRVNCSQYESPADGCEEVVRKAVECARDASDLVCANVAPESCAKPFRQITACAAGEKPTTTSEPSAGALPPGFSRYDNATEGVHAPMPDTAAAGGEAGVIVSAKHPSGAVYAIRKLPRPEGKLNEKLFLKLAMNLYGRCTDKMKMQGMVDKPGRTSINYTMTCPDGAAERGLFWATEKALFIASVRGNGADLGPTDAFLYGFEAK